MHKRHFFALLFLIEAGINAFSQSKHDSTGLDYHFDVEAQSFYQLTLKPHNPDYYEVHSDVVSNFWGYPVKPTATSVTDNPFKHTAFYARFKSEATYRKKYSLLFDVVLEHRGMSYGLNDLNNIVIFPLYKFDFHESYFLLRDSLKISFQQGCFTNNKLHQGLKIYNIDTQGINLRFDWNNLTFQIHDVADLSYGIGLDLEELTDVSLLYKKIFQKGKYLTLGINTSLNSYLLPNLVNTTVYHGIEKYNNYGTFGDFTFSENSRIYFQYELRNAPYVNIKENSGILVGGEFKKRYPKFEISFNPEIRYYGWMYNYGHKNDSVNYRFSDKKTTFTNVSQLYSSTIGRYLYPLMNFNNQFSQWAVYTDYQYQNIAGIEVRAKIHWFFSEKFSLIAEGESCTLIKEYQSEGKNTFTYLFYTNSLIYRIANKFTIRFEISNKAMNLDKHFQTFYMSKKPYIGFCIRKDFFR